jgi:hypothetical protein
LLVERNERRRGRMGCAQRQDRGMGRGGQGLGVSGFGAGGGAQATGRREQRPGLGDREEKVKTLIGEVIYSVVWTYSEILLGPIREVGRTYERAKMNE